MRNYLEGFFARYEYPADATEKLLSAYDMLAENDDFEALLKLFYAVDELNFIDIERALEKVSNDTEVHKYTTKFLYYVCLTKDLMKLYAGLGVDDDVIWDTLEDFKYKLYEGLEVHGIPGFFSTVWFYDLLRARIFKLGRLEYHIIKYNDGDINIGGVQIKNGDDSLNIHIPSSNEPFNTETRLASYDKAYSFFKKVFNKDVKLFQCQSWLLFPKQEEFLPEKSNIRSFMKDFRIIKHELFAEPRSNMWRIFGKYAAVPADELPRDSSLRRAYADYLSTGAYPGWGTGVFIWDDVNKKTLT